MNNLKQYFEYEKNNLDIDEGDFLRLLNNIDTRKPNYGVITSKNRIRSEYFGWSFGFIGLSLAAFMFFITPDQNASTVAVISKQDVETLREKSQKTVKVIDSIESFNTNNFTTE